MATQNQILVTGGTGKTGKRIVQQLQARDIPVRIGSRSAELAFDWENESTWSPVLADIHAVYIAYQPDLAIPGAVEIIQKFVNLAVESGVQHLVLLSGRGEDEAQRCEVIVQEAGIDWTILRCAFFNQNFDEGMLYEPLLADEFMLAAGDVGEPFVDVDDIADVAVAALTEAGHSGKLYELTGPRLMTFAEAVQEIAKASNREIEYIEVPLDAYVGGLRGAGVPEGTIWMVEYLFSTVLDGRNAYVCDGVEQALGRPARDFTTYASNVADTGVWHVGEK